MTARYTAVIGGERLEAAIARDGGKVQAQIGDRHYVLAVVRSRPGVFSIQFEDRCLEVIVTDAPGGGSIVSLDGRQIEVELLDTRASLRRAARRGLEGAVELRAPMPGKIVRVLVAEGDDVQTQQGIVVMEAMKMQNEIRAPKAGKVRKVNVREGTAVNSGEVIAEVE